MLCVQMSTEKPQPLGALGAKKGMLRNINTILVRKYNEYVSIFEKPY